MVISKVKAFSTHGGLFVGDVPMCIKECGKTEFHFYDLSAGLTNHRDERQMFSDLIILPLW